MRMMYKVPVLFVFSLLLPVQPTSAETVMLVEAESFAQPGGWVVDQQFVPQMGSPCLLAHGLGVPVADAETTISVAEAGDYRLWVRTRDWVPSHAEDPGRFQVVLNGTTLPTEFGTELGTWHWQDGGTVSLPAGTSTLDLHDLTGFDGRCDALALIKGSATPPPSESTALAEWRRVVLGEPTVPAVTETVDCVIVGGGLAGTCAALAAARDGIEVALIQDRPYLGGNASREIRVRSQGTARHAIVSSVRSTRTNTQDMSSDDDNRLALVQAEPNIHLFMPWRAYAAGTGPDGEVTHVDARHIETGETRRFAAPLFIDSTGDGWVGYWSGADYRMGREARAETGESRAPATPDAMTMGNTLMWTTRDTASPVSFPAVPWAMDVVGSAAATGGEWNWEYGMHLSTIDDAEEIRDYLLRAIYGNFYNAKQQAQHANRELAWVPFIAGKRESRRLMGDHILSEDDVFNGVFFEDAVGTGSWSIDLHEPITPIYRSRAIHTQVSPYYFPFRSLYSRNVPNLMMAGRCLSATHVGLGSPRVMNTCGQMGVAVGYAASICIARDILPRDVYRNADRTLELQAKITGAWPERPSEGQAVVDNSDVDTHFRVEGDWTGSTFNSGYYGDDYDHDGNADKGSKAAIFAPDLTADATYRVSMRWTEDISRASAVPVTIVQSAQVARITASDAVYIRNNMPSTTYASNETLVGRVQANVWIRSLLSFDLSSLPADARMLNARLDLVARDRDGSSGSDYVGTPGLRVYRLTESFNPAEVTWNERETGIAWTTPGGDADTDPVAIISDPTHPDQVVAGEVFPFPWRARLAGAVQADRSSGMLGLLVRTPGVESSYATRKLYRFASAAHTDPNWHPVLTVTYCLPGPPTHTVDQRSQGGGWVDLGELPLLADGRSAVIIDTTDTDGFVIADAVQFADVAVSTTDRDGDGLPDWWERWYFNSETAADQGEDTDLDSISNYGEYRTGTDPRDASSVFSVRDHLDSTGHDVLLRWPSATNRLYRIEQTEDLDQGFSLLIGDLPATPPENSYTVTPSQVTHFYRVLAED